ncbi:MAG TPA: serine/threonine-protein kinase [Polyangiaceae bacterium]|jgi:serine/threonine protein kinase
MPADGPSSRTTRQGELLGGKYVLEQRLGAGGMGEVWRARHVALDREVAIKVLRPEHADDRDVAARFLREARTANLVRHPNVVDVLDVGQDEHGAPFLVQELLRGQDLARHVAEQGGRLPVAAAMQLLLPVVDAVAFAHARGVVHRDLKPENVFLAREGEAVVPKLLDFGISHVAAGPRMTATGVALGTPAYMAPEQIKGRAVDARTDVWSLGVMVHEVLSGALPFTGETTADMFVQIATSPPIPLADAVPGVPEDLSRIVERCLCFAPEDRYADARALADDLRAFWGGKHLAAIASAPIAASGPSERELASTVAARVPPSLHHVGVVRSSPEPSRHRDFISLAPAPDAAALQLASTRPPRHVARFRSLRPMVQGFDTRRLLTTLAFSILALLAGGVLTMMNPWPDGWALAAAVSSLLAALPVVAARAVAVTFAVLALLVGLRGWRLAPVSWGHFVAAAGGVALAVVLLAGETSAALPWAAALTTLGLAAIVLRSATDAWLGEMRGGAVVLLAVATAVLFAAAQLAHQGGAAEPR